MNLKVSQILLVISISVLLLTVIYSAVTFYQLRQPSQPEKPGIRQRVSQQTPTASVSDASSGVKDESDDKSSGRNPQSSTEGDFSARATPDESAARKALVEAFTGLDDDGQTVSSAAEEFPEVPEDYPLKPIWTAPGFVIENLRRPDRRILLDKVLIKLWMEGDHDFVNGCTMSGFVYPLYPNTIYVRWEEVVLPDGIKKRVARRITGIGDVELPPHPVFEDSIPSGTRVIDMDSEEGQGIDPYEFLQHN